VPSPQQDTPRARVTRPFFPLSPLSGPRSPVFCGHRLFDHERAPVLSGVLFFVRAALWSAGQLWSEGKVFDSFLPLKECLSRGKPGRMRFLIHTPWPVTDSF